MCLSSVVRSPSILFDALPSGRDHFVVEDSIRGQSFQRFSID
jgi:hypothetical protein